MRLTTISTFIIYSKSLSEKVIVACRKSGPAIEDHFAKGSKLVDKHAEFHPPAENE